MLRNPVSTKDLAELVKSLWTPSTQYLSITGGEPLLHTQFISELAEEFCVPLYLKTNAMFSREAKQLKHAVHSVACDIKLPKHRATPTYDLLLREELRTVKCFHNSPAYVLAKVVVLEETSSEMVESWPKALRPLTTIYCLCSSPSRQFSRLHNQLIVSSCDLWNCCCVFKSGEGYTADACATRDDVNT